MSELDKNIKAAQAKNMATGLIIGVAAAVIFIVYFGWLFLTKGYSIDVMPLEAKATQQISVAGAGFSVAGSVYRIGGDITVTVDAPKFDPETVVVTAVSPSVISVTLTPSPGTVNAVTQPADVNTLWSVNGEPVSIGTDLTHKLQPGEHVLTADNKFYEPFTTTIAIASDETTNVDAALQPINGEIIIQTTPPGAEVFVQSLSVGVSPLRLSKAGGAYDVVVKHAGYEDTTDVIELSSTDRNPARHYRLEPTKGFLNITASPADGVLLIDGKLQAVGRQAVYSNQPHKVVYQKDGYYTVEVSATVAPNEEKNIAIALKPEYGSVVLNSSPAASIYINGQLKGEGSFKASLSATEHIVEFKKPGYRTVKTTFKPSSNRSTKIDASMLTEFEARKKEGVKLFSETIGINMLGFTPTPFTMGSPVNEQGRRRNEYQVPVTFNKSIVVGQHEITEAQYAHYNSAISSSQNPVANLSWNDAALYCNWLSEKDGLPAFYNVRAGVVIGANTESNGYRLLTEAEWEWLAKKYMRSTSSVFVWGNDNKLPKKSANIADASVAGKQTFFFKDEHDGFVERAPVGSFKASNAGLYDLVGNVSEWVNDFHTYQTPQSASPLVNYMGPASGVSHIYKGSNYKTGKIEDLRASYRETSDKPEATIGFRVARYK